MTTCEELQERLREAKKAQQRYVPEPMTPFEELEDRVRRLEDRISHMENARFSVGREYPDGIPGKPEYVTWDEASGAQGVTNHTNYSSQWRVWDHSVTPPRDVTNGVK